MKKYAFILLLSSFFLYADDDNPTNPTIRTNQIKTDDSEKRIEQLLKDARNLSTEENSKNCVWTIFKCCFCGASSTGNKRKFSL
jgi:hypothetical protein